MDSEAIIVALEELADKLGIEIRREPFGGEGGICQFRGKRILFVDSSLDELSQVDVIASALCEEPIEHLYVVPEIRDLLERMRSRKS